ncbi:MAG: hypothetical protein R2681_01785 [Pyrinomonadaceae bacterium]
MKNDLRNEKFARQKGGAGVKLILVLVFIFLIGNAGFRYVPVAYQGETLKQELTAAVIQGMAVVRDEKPQAKVKKLVTAVVRKNGAPDDTFIQVREVKNVVEARVSYAKKVDILPFGLYEYDYIFDETVTPSGLLFD